MRPSPVLHYPVPAWYGNGRRFLTFAMQVRVCSDGAILPTVAWRSNDRFIIEGSAELQAPPLQVKFSQAFKLTMMWHCVDWWNARWLESDSSTQDAHSQPHLIAAGVLHHQWHTPLPMLKVLFTVHQSFALLLGFSLWERHASHSPGFSCRILMTG